MKTTFLLSLISMALSGCATNNTAYNSATNSRLNANLGKDGYEPVQILHSEDPIYPLHARKTGRPMTVSVAFTVDTDGKPKDISVTETPDPFYNILFIECMSKWRFKPAHKNGVPVEARFKLPMNLKPK